MVTATKEFKWEMAHMLTEHSGLCANVHGHSYRMQVTVSRISNTILKGSSKGMVIDFQDLKKIVNEEIVDKLDHALMLDTTAEGIEAELIKLLAGKVKIYYAEWRPTAENMAYHFYEALKARLLFYDNTIRLESVKIWETDTAFAEYTK